MARKQWGEGRQEIEDNTLSESVLPISRNEKFFLLHSETGWFHDNADGWLPLLDEVPLRPGANGVTGQDGKRDASALFGVLQRNGLNTIGPQDARLPVEYRNYVRSHACKNGRYYHLKWARPEVINGVVRWNVDTKGHHKFLLDVVAAGVVEPMQRVVLEVELERIDKRIGNLENRAAAVGPALNRKIQAAIVKRAKMIEDYERQFGEAENDALAAAAVNVDAIDDGNDIPGALPPKPAKVPKRKPAAEQP